MELPTFKRGHLFGLEDYYQKCKKRSYTAIACPGSEIFECKYFNIKKDIFPHFSL